MSWSPPVNWCGSCTQEWMPLIIQDMALLELDLPPIQLHASTQCDIRTPAKARFLQDAGMSQLVLARELTPPR